MRVRRLRLQDYRRYRDVEVELPDGVTAVLGPNGSGKSSLLEALSFALFGPAALRTGKDLLRRDGAAPSDPVRVELDVELGGQALRIVRELRGKSMAPNATLEADGVVLVPPGAGSSEAATREVERRLGMDREAFHTTVMAQQGELARLADAKPADRKRMVLRMLGIDRVEAAIEEARTRRNVAAQTLERLRAALPDVAALQDEATQATKAAETARAELAVRQAEAEAASQAAAAATQALADEEARHAVHQERRRQHAALAAQAQRTEADLARVLRELHEAEAAARKAELLAATAAQVEPLEEALRAATVAEAARGQHAERLRSIARQRDAVARLQADLAALAPVTVPAGAADGARRQLLRLQADLQARSQEVAVLEERWRVLERRRTELGRLGPEAPCPTCERPLNGQFEHLHAATGAHGADLLGRRRESERELARLRGEEEAARRTVDVVLRQESEAQRAEARRAELARLLAHEASRLAELESTVVPEPPAGPDLAQLRAQALAARRAREDLARAQALAQRLPALVAQRTAAEQALADARQALQALEADLRGFDPATLAAARAHRVHCAAALAAAEARIHQSRAAVEQSAARVASLDERLAQARALQAQVADVEREAQVLGAVVGRAGGGLLDRFRDHLVGRVGPAISAEASRLLARFTGGRYTELLLDDEHQVYVADNGVPYTLDRFSGGEADLVHLALRLAVSRLLAERGGTELRFLALDEVFGSLDRDRRGLVVAALQELGTLYSQVLVVSHLEGLQEDLGQALRVAEDADGSARLQPA